MFEFRLQQVLDVNREPAGPFYAPYAVYFDGPSHKMQEVSVVVVPEDQLGPVQIELLPSQSAEELYVRLLHERREQVPSPESEEITYFFYDPKQVIEQLPIGREYDLLEHLVSVGARPTEQVSTKFMINQFPSITRAEEYMEGDFLRAAQNENPMFMVYKRSSA